MVDDESGESTREDEVAGVGRDKLRLETLVRSCEVVGEKPEADSRGGILKGTISDS